MGRCRTHCQRADQEPQAQAPVFLGPCGDDLHAHRVYGRERDTSGKPEQQSQRKPVSDEWDQGVQAGACERSRRKDLARLPDVRNVEQRAGEGTGDESELHGHSQPRGVTRAEVPFLDQEGGDGRGREPQAHDQEFGQSKQQQDAPFLGNRQPQLLFCGRTRCASPIRKRAPVRRPPRPVSYPTALSYPRPLATWRSSPVSKYTLFFAM